MIERPPKSTPIKSSAASDVYKRQWILRVALYSTVVQEFEKIPEITECHFTTGPYTMLIKLYAKDNQHLMELLNKKIQMIPE